MKQPQAAELRLSGGSACLGLTRSWFLNNNRNPQDATWLRDSTGRNKNLYSPLWMWWVQNVSSHIPVCFDLEVSLFPKTFNRLVPGWICETNLADVGKVDPWLSGSQPRWEWFEVSGPSPRLTPPWPGRRRKPLLVGNYASEIISATRVGTSWLQQQNLLIMVVVLTGSQPVYLWNVPNRCCSEHCTTCQLFCHFLPLF